MKEYKYKNKIDLTSQIPFDVQLEKVLDEKRLKELKEIVTSTIKMLKNEK